MTEKDKTIYKPVGIDEDTHALIWKLKANGGEVFKGRSAREIISIAIQRAVAAEFGEDGGESNARIG